MSNLKIVGYNQDIRWKDKAFNFNNIEKIFKDVNADIFVLPEMFSTGFCMQPDEIADKNNETLIWMQGFAKAKNAAICGSVSVEEGGVFYNRMYFVKPDETFKKYDKRHLFSYSGEHKAYEAGKERVVVSYKGVNILLQVCYDVRFPVFARNLKDYDLSIYVANWPDKRVDIWKTLLKARAIENQAYAFGVNRVGTDGNNISYEESSYCFFADGNQISQRQGDLIFAEIDLEKLKIFRTKFQFLNDADGFDMKLQ